MKRTLVTCFIDFKKAFDSVWRDALLLKLLDYGICGNFFRTIEDMYCNGYAHIKSNGLLSEAIPSEVGVRQGDILSPNLFNLFINDLPKCLSDSADCPKLGNRSIKCLLYADDLVIFSHSLSGLQVQLDHLSTYCKNWGLEINLKKSKVMIISKNTHPVMKDEAPCVGEHALEIVEWYKYLGLVVYSNGKLLQTTSNLCARGWKAIFKLNLSLRGCDTKTHLRVKLFDTLVKPILCYGAEVWGGSINSNNDEATFWKRAETLPVEQFHLKIIKSSLFVHSKASNAASRCETGRYPILIHIVKLMLNYWKHMEKSKHDNPLLYEAMRSELENCSHKGSWFYAVNAVIKLMQDKSIKSYTTWNLAMTNIGDHN